MIILHNLLAMNANIMTGINKKSQAKSSEKLSSGYKINRAADDAAGLSISEKARRQIRGLDQASKNSQDGISLVQIADGAMSEVHEMINRGIELTVQAANGTLSDSDRYAIQQEIEQLKQEINSISQRTKFNEIQVFQGEKGIANIEIGTTPVLDVVGGMPAWVDYKSTNGIMEETYITSEDYIDKNGNPQSVDISHAAAILDFSQFDPSKIGDLVKSGGFHMTCCTCDNYYSIKFTNDTTSNMERSGSYFIYNIGIGGVTSVDDLLDRIIEGTKGEDIPGLPGKPGNPNNHYTKLAKDNNGRLIIYDDRSSDPKSTEPGDVDSWTSWDNPYWDTEPRNGRGRFGPGVAYQYDEALFRKGEIGWNKNISLQVGADTGNRMAIALPCIDSRQLGIEDVDVRVPGGPERGIDAFKEASSYVSSERSRMGAYQNRLEDTIKNLDNVTENTQAAESAIRDTDMPTEVVKYFNTNILLQSGESMLAQANQTLQSVLNLLQ